MPNQPSDLQSFLKCTGTHDYVVIDTETTGLKSDDEICDIAIISSTGEVLLSTLVKPCGPIWSEASDIHGITNDMVCDAPTWAQLRQEIIDLIGDKVVVTYNATFDRKMFHQSDTVLGLDRLDWQGIAHWYDAMQAFSERYGEWNEYYGNFRWKKLSEAAAFYHCLVRESHRALSDAQTTLDVIKCMIDESYLTGKIDDEK